MSHPLSTAPRIALIGCGAIAEVFYLPALRQFPEVFEKVILVDSNRRRLDELAAKFGAATREPYYDRIADQVDGAIVALPHQLHYRVSMELLGKGVHVLCEKPLAETAPQAREMVAEAERAGVTLSVNNTRRLFPAYAKVKELISAGDIGALVSVRYVDGARFNWPTASGFYFKGSQRGVLFDRGVHGLDAICWWLGGKPHVVESSNDSFGGVEGVARVRFERDGCAGEAMFTWLNALENTYRIVGENGEICGGIEDWWVVTLKTRGGREHPIRIAAPQKTYEEFGSKLIGNWIQVIGGSAQPLVPARDVLDSIELIDECYRQAGRFRMPWYDNWTAYGD